MGVIALVAALDRNFAIGRDGAMPWHLPDDLRRFKRLTLGKPVLMGSRTARAIGFALPGRENLVLTRSRGVPYAGQVAVASIEAALERTDDRELMVIGGGEVYTQAIDRATHLHLTWIDGEVEVADAFFPRFDADEWEITADEVRAADARTHSRSGSFGYQRRGRRGACRARNLPKPGKRSAPTIAAAVLETCAHMSWEEFASNIPPYPGAAALTRARVCGDHHAATMWLPR